jgi:chemotaxis protein histidine kinase CheA
MYFPPRMGKGPPMIGGKGGGPMMGGPPMGGKGPMMPPMGAPFPPPGKGFPMMGGKGVPPMAGKGMAPYPGPPMAAPFKGGPGPYGRPFGAPPPQQPYGAPYAPAEAVYPFLQRERKLPELCKRQPRLHYSQDLLQAVCHWVDHSQAASDIPLDTPTSFTVGAEGAVTVPSDFEKEQEGAEDTGADTYRARVVLLSPLVTDEKKHKAQKIRFVLGQNAKGNVVPYGGPWSPKDGADPTKDATLVATAIRHTKAQCGLDLSRCKKWTKVIEVQYRRKSGAIDHTVVFVPDVWTAFPDGADKTELLKATMTDTKEVEEEVSEEVEEEVEKEIEEEVDAEEGEGQKKTVKKMVKEMVKKTVKKKVKAMKEYEKVALKPVELTLQTLLEVNTADAGEASVEAALFGGAFDEMVSYLNAKQILQILRKKKKEADEQAAVQKRKRDEEQGERQAQVLKQRDEYEAKKRKVDEDAAAKKAEAARLEAEEKDLDPDTVKQRREAREKAAEEEKQRLAEEAKQRAEEERQRKEREAKQKKEEEDAQKKAQDAEDRARGYRIIKQTVTHVDEEMATPFQYFDRPTGASGQIRKEIIEGLLHALGELTSREVDALLRSAGVLPDRTSSPLLYRRLASYTVTEEKRIDLPPEPKAPPAAPAAPAADAAEQQEDGMLGAEDGGASPTSMEEQGGEEATEES